MSTVELNDHPDDGTVARHREGAGFVGECRRVFEPVTARPRQTDRDVGRIVQIDAWVGAVPQWDAAAQDLAGAPVRAGMARVECDPRARAGRPELARPLGQDAARVGLEVARGLRQGDPPRAAGTTERDNESADLSDPHGGTLASSDAELWRRTRDDENVMRVQRMFAADQCAGTRLPVGREQ
ncbi:MAG: hypothetical protein JWP48_5869 [Actinoallomurus sp.]|nr:hypothetical protein [Actinoallomurus sp.]